MYIISRWTKQDTTQLQWSFQCVDSSDFFPLGVQTLYRAYSDDNVIEIVKAAIPYQTKCAQELGLQAVETTVSWQPKAHKLPANRPG